MPKLFRLSQRFINCDERHFRLQNFVIFVLNVYGISYDMNAIGLDIGTGFV